MNKVVFSLNVAVCLLLLPFALFDRLGAPWFSSGANKTPSPVWTTGQSTLLLAQTRYATSLCISPGLGNSLWGYRCADQWPQNEDAVALHVSSTASS